MTEGLTGRVVEVGFGSGLNSDYYPAEVDLVLAVEPAAVARKLAEKRISRSAVAIEHVGMDGQSIPLDDNSCDSALSTFTLCTIPDVRQALNELRRVMRPGGRFHDRARRAALRQGTQSLELVQRRDRDEPPVVQARSARRLRSCAVTSASSCSRSSWRSSSDVCRSVVASW